MQKANTRVWLMFLSLVVVRRARGFHAAGSTRWPCWCVASSQSRCRARTTAATRRCAGSGEVSAQQQQSPAVRQGLRPAIAAYSISKQLLVHWRGEDVEGYSLQFRHDEFRGALSAVVRDEARNSSEPFSLDFRNALNYSGTELTSDLKLKGYNQAMQYITVPKNIPVSACIQAAERSSLIHALYEIVAESCCDEGYDALSEIALENGCFDDMKRGGPNEDDTWCVRVRHYGKNLDGSKERRYGARARSLTMERQALQALKPVLLCFGGKVDLNEPDCKIYVFDGLYTSRNNAGFSKVLTRRIATGARVATLNPNTRLCVTNTPLCPVAAFTMCNVAQIQSHSTVLDPFCGSGATLLASAMIAPHCKTVGIEIAHNGIVCRDDIRRDFAMRNLSQPEALIYGDSSDSGTRAQARDAIGNAPFDCIVTDPPYGIRESTGFMERPIDELFQMITDDRNAGTPLLRKGGRLVAFLPQQTELESFADIMPTAEQMQAAGLRNELTREQPLNDILSRWLVSFICVE